jgi:hypothetical protein
VHKEVLRLFFPLPESGERIPFYAEKGMNPSLSEGHIQENTGIDTVSPYHQSLI